MTDQGICGKCSQRNGCKDIYQQIADNKGPSVLAKVVIAFVLPLLSFVLAIAVFSRLITRITSSQSAVTLLSFVLAVGVTALVLVLSNVASRWFGKIR